jgi:hypothetical protein
MNNSTIAKNGFKTFILTLAVCLIVFSVIYYIQTDSSNKVNIESTDKVSQAKEDASKQVASAADTSVFKAITNDKTQVPTKAVLGSATTTETTQSTVPTTGITEITYAFVVSLGITLFGVYLFVYEPRRRALLDFERKVKKDLR